MRGKRDAIIRRLGPVGLSLLAAGVTAVAFAAVSLAANGNGNGSNDNGARTQALPPPPGGGPGVMTFRDRLSEADRQKLDDFRKCMEENGAPAPPDPGKIDPSQGPPKPPSQADQDKIQKAYEACKDKLPEGMQNAGPPHLGAGPLCGPPPGAPGQRGQQQGQSRQGQSQQQSYRSSSSSGGWAS